MLKKVEQALLQQNLIAEGDHILVAVSGGADSVAMLYILFSLSRSIGFSLGVIHINHGLRGKASDKDARFVKALAWSLGLTCQEKKVDTQKAANQPGISLEMAARKLRQEAYRDACRTEGAQSVAVGHTREDQAETVLMRLTRGSGPRGLGGIRYSNSIGSLHLIRPCLNIPRMDLRNFLRTHGIAWREDTSNQSRKFTRNRIRHDVLPELEKLNPSAVKHITHAAALCRDDDEALEQMLVPHLPTCVSRDRQGRAQIHAAAYCELPKALQRRVLMHWLDDIGMESWEMGTGILVELDAMLWHVESSHMTLPGDIQVHRAHGVLSCVPPPCGSFNYPLIEEERLLIPEADVQVTTRWVKHMDQRPQPKKMLEYPQEGFVALKKKDVGLLRMRGWREGDVLRPLGMTGSKKLQDVFMDAKVPRPLRHCIPLLCLGDEVLWIPGYQIARRCKVNESSKRILHLCVSAL